VKLNPKVQASLDKVIQQFRSGDLSPVIEATLIRLPETAPARKWTYSNRVLAYAQTLSVDCRGYRQWQEVHRFVKRGENAGYIFVPRIATVEDEVSGEEKKELHGFLAVPIFGYGQTDGEPIGYEPVEPPPLLAVAQRFGIEVAWEPGGGTSLGSTDPAGKAIKLMSHDASIFFHELGHAVHARLNGRLKGGQDPYQETVAELAGCVLASLYGYDVSGSAWRYFEHYNPDPLRAIMIALEDVEAILMEVTPK